MNFNNPDMLSKKLINTLMGDSKLPNLPSGPAQTSQGMQGFSGLSSLGKKESGVTRFSTMTDVKEFLKRYGGWGKYEKAAFSPSDLLKF